MIAEAGVLVSALSHSLAPLLLGRVLQGAGAATIPLGVGIIRDEFPLGRVSGGISMFSAAIGVGTGLGIVVAGPIVDALGVQ